MISRIWTSTGRAAALAEAVDPERVRAEAVTALCAFLEKARAAPIPEGCPLGFRDQAGPTGIRVSLVEEVTERAEALERSPEPLFRVDSLHLPVNDGGSAECVDDPTVHFTRTYDTDIAPRLRAAFAR